MKSAVRLVARVNDGSGKFPFVPVNTDKLVKGLPVAPNGSTAFYLRFSDVRQSGKNAGTRGRVVEPVGSNLEAAYAQFLTRQIAQKQIQAGLAPIAVALAPAASGTSLKSAVAEYLADCEATGTSDTVESKKRTLQQFLEVCAANGIGTIDALREAKTGRKAALGYLKWMRDHLVKLDIEGANPENTYFKRMSQVRTFLKHHAIKLKKDYNAGPNDPGLLTHTEFPKSREKKASTYSDETIAKMLAVADEDEADLIYFYTETGFRRGEAEHAEWSDIDFVKKSINVHAKPKTANRAWEWKPKDKESRQYDLPLSDGFVERMKARRERMKSQRCALIFPSGICKPDGNLLRRVRRVAQRAGVTEYIGQHKFRRTFGSKIARTEGVSLAQKFLGHSDLKTTQRYLDASPDVESYRARINAAK
jgi:integrase